MADSSSSSKATPLFSSPGSVYRRQTLVHDDEDGDEAEVDASIPSTPIDEDTYAFSEVPLPTAGPSKTTHQPRVETEVRPGRVKEENLVDLDDTAAGKGDFKPEVTPLREIDPEGRPDDKQCRICFGGSDEEEALGKLISPCLCTGSMRYVHVKCINAWRGTGSNAKAYLECPQCHHQYRLRRTLVSGLATSRPVLMVLTTILFFILTVFTGALLHYLLTASPSARERVYTARTPVSSVFSFNDDDDDYWNDGTVIIIGGGGTLIYDIVLGAIQMFTHLAIRFAHTQEYVFSIFPWPIGEAIFFLGIRFLLGLAVLGSFSFLSLILSFSLFGPLHIFNSLRGMGIFRNFARRRREGGSFSQFMIIAFVMIGTINTLFKVYGWIQSKTMKLLIYVETQILEVNPDERRRAAEEAQRQREQSWMRRWIREGRWKTRSGWVEILVRSYIRVRDVVRVQWELLKARMEQPLDPLDVVEE